MEDISQFIDGEQDSKNDRVEAYCDAMIKILKEEHTIASLEIVCEMGYRVEFDYKSVLYQIYPNKDQFLLVCPSLKSQVQFELMRILIMYALIDGNHFIDIWDEIEIKNVYSMI